MIKLGDSKKKTLKQIFNINYLDELLTANIYLHDKHNSSSNSRNRGILKLNNSGNDAENAEENTIESYKSRINEFADYASNFGNIKKLSICEFLQEMYRYMVQSYPIEYVYKNELMLSLPQNTACCNEFVVNKSRADMIIYGKNATACEIKTELDVLDRLKTQISDYYKVFNRVCILTSENHLQEVLDYTKSTTVGVLLWDGKTVENKKTAIVCNRYLDNETLLSLLSRSELDILVKSFQKTLPEEGNPFYLDECKEILRPVPIELIHSRVLETLYLKAKQHNKDSSLLNICVPQELKLFERFTKKYKDRSEAFVRALHSNLEV